MLPHLGDPWQRPCALMEFPSTPTVSDILDSLVLLCGTNHVLYYVNYVILIFVAVIVNCCWMLKIKDSWFLIPHVGPMKLAIREGNVKFKQAAMIPLGGRSLVMYSEIQSQWFLLCISQGTGWALWCKFSETYFHTWKSLGWLRLTRTGRGMTVYVTASDSECRLWCALQSSHIIRSFIYSYNIVIYTYSNSIRHTWPKSKTICLSKICFAQIYFASSGSIVAGSRVFYSA